MRNLLQRRDVEGNRCRSRPRLGMMDSVRMSLVRGMSVEQGRLNALNRTRWELIVRSK